MSAKIIRMPSAAERAGVRVGSIFVNSWGYDQTNIDYYVVVEVTPSGKTVKLRKVGTRAVVEQGSHDQVVPSLGVFCGECGNCGQQIRNARIYDEAEGGIVHFSGLAECYDGKGTATPRIYAKRLVTSYNGKPMLSWNSYSKAYLWDGKPDTQTAPGFGH